MSVKFSPAKIVPASLLIMSLLVLLMPNIASAQFNFGGIITYMDPYCEGWIPFVWYGMFFWLGPPSFLPVMWIPATVTTYYSYGPPTHPGQWLFGAYAPAWMPCILWIWVPCGFWLCPVPIIKGGGFPILYNGSSL
ncbi:MAG: hypothetical protein A3D52_00225 [Candidatus Taylorbacteria bacterium RIFCSPHIGHO2_02_FULL_44_36]|uniref:Uncharacterized protein n=1 Tax=Candidatus Taylorbacteria bacterium RIFCSPLOWO2_12_FULL_44_15c TaxID=1802333 RepID=A0A1G2P4W8_9BACT|nr:MAG: hypothetical protein A3D52_00225 [Candidatus Taylorbacteria bacterium RIFCSPHIGHO2_02_FULL_44_36]OHA39174.1 MAG: hypothetical protein A3I97_00655 [Candidatus Taylorbacteria bacterium RIFCSPLOWO2_02_FULL_44_35]OHA43378.1 MAG: hypothetical protein A3G03_03370 [Candidatus Taylorbacteria bacterium RIFCSPLOWO2_12_FULL_44_15c]